MCRGKGVVLVLPDSELAAGDSRKILMVAPHSDDIALCLGGWLSQRYGSNSAPLHDLQILTVFTWSRSVPHRKLAADDILAAVRCRAEEEKAFAASLAIPVSLAGLPDTSVLGIEHLADQDIELDWRMHFLRSNLAPVIPGRIIFAPISLGNHVDHRICTAVCLEHAARAQMVVFYEDLPYATWSDRTEREATIRRKLGSDARPFRIELNAKAREQKAELLRVYRSQLSDEEIEIVLKYRAMSSGCTQEVVWLRNPTADQTRALESFGFRPSD